MTKKLDNGVDAETGVVACSDAVPIQEESFGSAKYTDMQKMDRGYVGEDIGVADNWKDIPGVQVKYLDEDELETFKVFVHDGLLKYSDGQLLDSGETSNGKLIFVMDGSGNIYAAEGRVFEFHHSSFFKGGEVASAGEMEVANGKLLDCNETSGHYKPTEAQHAQFLSELKARGLKLG